MLGWLFLLVAAGGLWLRWERQERYEHRGADYYQHRRLDPVIPYR